VPKAQCKPLTKNVCNHYENIDEPTPSPHPPEASENNTVVDKKCVIILFVQNNAATMLGRPSV